MARAHLSQPEALQYIVDVFLRILSDVFPFQEIVDQPVMHEQHFRILRHQSYMQLVRIGDTPALGLADAGKRREQRGLAAAVAADERCDAARMDVEVDAAQNERHLLGVAEPQVACGNGHVVGRNRAPDRTGCDLAAIHIARVLHGVCNERAPFAHRHRIRSVLVDVQAGTVQAGGHARRRRQRTPETLAVVHEHANETIAVVVVNQHAALLQEQHAIGYRQHVLETVLDDDDRYAELGIHALKHVEEILRGNGVKLRRRFVEHQHGRLHDHDGRQVQELFLTTRQVGGPAVEPSADAEEVRGFRDAAVHRLGVHADVFQTEGQLVPHRVGDDLVLGILHDETDARGRLDRTQRVRIVAEHANLPAGLALYGKLGLERAQERRLARTRHAAERRERAFVQAERHAVQHVYARFPIRERVVLHFKRVLGHGIQSSCHASEPTDADATCFPSPSVESLTSSPLEPLELHQERQAQHQRIRQIAPQRHDGRHAWVELERPGTGHEQHHVHHEQHDQQTENDPLARVPLEARVRRARRRTVTASAHGISCLHGILHAEAREDRGHAQTPFHFAALRLVVTADEGFLGVVDRMPATDHARNPARDHRNHERDGGQLAPEQVRELVFGHDLVVAGEPQQDGGQHSSDRKAVAHTFDGDAERPPFPQRCRPGRIEQRVQNTNEQHHGNEHAQ